MPLYQTGGYQVKPSAVNKVKQAIKELVAYVQANEPGTQMYLAWQQKDDPTRFLHLGFSNVLLERLSNIACSPALAGVVKSTLAAPLGRPSGWA